MLRLFSSYFKRNKLSKPYIYKEGRAKGLSKCMSYGKRAGSGFSKDVSKNINDIRKSLNKRGKARSKQNYIIKNSLLRNVILDEGSTKIEGYRLFCDNKNSFYMGKHLIRNATRKQKYRKLDDRFLEAYYLNKQIFDEYELDVERAVIIEGCYNTNKHTLQSQLTPEREGDFLALPDDINCFNDFDKIIKNVIRKLKIETLSKCEIDDLSFSSYNKDTKPGFRYEEYLGMMNKSKAKDIALECAKIRWKAIDKGKFSHNDIAPSYYTIGARNKRDYTYEEEELATSRVVHMPEFHVELVSGVWTDAITELIKRRKNGPIYIGNSIVDYERLVRDCKDSKVILEGDWKRYDSTLYIKLVTMACAILRCYFPLKDPEIDAHFIAIFDSLAIKDYICPGGNIYRVLHGLPSGVKSTSLIGSIINLIVLSYCMHDVSDSKKFNFIVGGDDFLIVNKDEHCDSEIMIDEFHKKAEELGMQLKFCKKKEFEGDNIDDYPCFYKYTVFKGKPVVPTACVLERTFMPWNKNYNTDLKIYKFLQDVMPSLGAPMSHCCLFYKFYASIHNRIHSDKITMANVYRYHERMYHKVFKLHHKHLLIKKSVDIDYVSNYNKVGITKLDLKIFYKHL